MEEHLREIEGTLARTSERKSTILYQEAKRRSEALQLQRLNITSLPTVPSEVTDVRVIRLILYRLNQQIGDQRARLHSSKVSIEKDGEGFVRALNDSVNQLIQQARRWNHQMAVLRGEPDEGSQRRQKKVYFGCARQLPEAPVVKEKKGEAKSPTEADDEVDDQNSLTMDELEESDDEEEASAAASSTLLTAPTAYTEYIQSLLPGGERDRDLMTSESSAAAVHAGRRRPRSEDSDVNGALHQVHHGPSGLLITTYGTRDGAESLIPSEEVCKQRLLDARRARLQAKLKAMREGGAA